MNEPADMIPPLLREMRSENKALHRGTVGRLERVERRLARLDEQHASFRQALPAELLQSKLVPGEFEERIEVREKKVKDLEAVK